MPEGIVAVTGETTGGDSLVRGLEPAKAAEVMEGMKAEIAKHKEESRAWKAEREELATLRAEREAAKQAQLTEVEKERQRADTEAKRRSEVEGELAAANRRSAWNEALPDYLSAVPENIRPSAKKVFEAAYLTEKWTNTEEMTVVLQAAFADLNKAFGNVEADPKQKPAVGGASALSALRAAQGEPPIDHGDGSIIGYTRKLAQAAIAEARGAKKGK
jgi:hypothetical protein